VGVEKKEVKEPEDHRDYGGKGTPTQKECGSIEKKQKNPHRKRKRPEEKGCQAKKKAIANFVQTGGKPAAARGICRAWCLEQEKGKSHEALSEGGKEVEVRGLGLKGKKGKHAIR